MMKTFQPKPREVEEKWWLVDADRQIVGRLAARIAAVLRGKTRPTFAPHVKNGDHVIVVNAEKVIFTGNKENQKIYYSHTGYPGGVKETTPKRLREGKPEEIMRKAVWGMMPKTRLGRHLMKNLRIFVGSEHTHQAQKPEVLALKTREARTEDN
jgi:large subunit ribosomal protein L13